MISKVFRILMILMLGLGLAACEDLFSDSSQAPNVQFTDLNGTRHELKDFEGKVVLFKFWSTDCTTCVAQMPDNISYQDEYGPEGFEVIAIALKHDPIDYVRNFAQSRALPFMVASDSDGEIAKAFGDVRMTPTAFLIDRKGRIVKRYLGLYDKNEFKQTVEKALQG